MEQEQFENTENNFRMDAKCLLEEIQPLLTDFCVCEWDKTENALFVRLINGKTFKLTLREIQ